MKSLNLALAFALSSPGLSAYAATANGLKVDQLFVRSQGAQDFHVAVQGKVAAELALRLPVETDPEMSPGTSDLTLLSPGSVKAVVPPVRQPVAGIFRDVDPDAFFGRLRCEAGQLLVDHKPHDIGAEVAEYDDGIEPVAELRGEQALHGIGRMTGWGLP